MAVEVEARAGLWLVLCTFVLSTVLYRSEAHEGASGVVKVRMDAMSEMASSAKAINQMVKGRRELDLERIARLAQAITSHAADIPMLFPDAADSRDGLRTQAMPAIWERWPRFVAQARTLEEEGERLAALARTGDASAIAGQFKNLGKACSSCHRDFRKKKKKKR